jgi:hypothetical protein
VCEGVVVGWKGVGGEDTCLRVYVFVRLSVWVGMCVGFGYVCACVHVHKCSCLFVLHCIYFNGFVLYMVLQRHYFYGCFYVCIFISKF